VSSPGSTYARIEGDRHSHGEAVHEHPHTGPHEHGDREHDHHHGGHGHGHREHDHDHADSGRGHSHGLVDPSIKRSRDGLRAVAWSLLVLGATALAQTLIFVLTGSVALLADLIHNFGDALTAIPLGLAFFLRSRRGERLAGFAVVLVIFASAVVALIQTIERFIHPQTLTHLWWLAAAGVIGFAGNEIAARIRLRAGKRLSSPALVADGNHARTDGFVSLGVLASAALVALGAQIADPIIGLILVLVILRITWQSWLTVSTAEPGEMLDAPDGHDDHHH
jgi:Co/Zn/Cd efflux system component